MKILIAYLILINIITFYVYADDKRRAKKRSWRTSEAVLIILALIGGSLGALLAMWLFHHKTRHLQFVISVPIILITHVLLFFFIMYGDGFLSDPPL